MPSIKIREISISSKEDIDEASRVLDKAFRESALVATAVSGNWSLNYRFQHAVVCAAAIGGLVHVASYDDVEIAGVACWFPPGTALLSSEEQQNAGFNAFMGSLPEEGRQWWTEIFLPTYTEQTTSVLGEGVKLDNWHLQMFGVAPELQNKGVGTALLQHIEARAFAEGKKVCLETDSELNASKYKHWGYSELDQRPYPGCGDIPGFPLYVFMKEPQR